VQELCGSGANQDMFQQLANDSDFMRRILDLARRVSSRRQPPPQASAVSLLALALPASPPVRILAAGARRSTWWPGEPRGARGCCHLRLRRRCVAGFAAKQSVAVSDV